MADQAAVDPAADTAADTAAADSQADQVADPAVLATADPASPVTAHALQAQVPARCHHALTHIRVHHVRTQRRALTQAANTGHANTATLKTSSTSGKIGTSTKLVGTRKTNA